MRVTNNGPDDQTGPAMLTVNPGNGLAADAVSLSVTAGACGLAGSRAVCAVDPLAAGRVAEMTFDARVEAERGSTITASARALVPTSDTDPVAGNDTGRAAIRLTGPVAGSGLESDTQFNRSAVTTLPDARTRTDPIHSPITLRISPASRRTMAGRHASPRRRRSWPRRILALVTAVVLLAAGAVVANAFLSQSAGSCEQAPALAVVADPAIAPALTEFAGSFQRSAPPVNGMCTSVDVVALPSADVVAGLGSSVRADMWISDSSLRASQVSAEGVALDVGDPLVISPLVVVAPRPVAEQLGWVDSSCRGARYSRRRRERDNTDDDDQRRSAGGLAGRRGRGAGDGR